MNKLFGRILATLALATLGTLLGLDRAAAETPKPALTIAFAGFDQLSADLKLIDQIDAHLDLATKFDSILQAVTAGKNLDGLDKSRPWGVLVSIGDSGQPVAVAYLPVTDLKKLVDGLPAPGGEKLKPNANGAYEITASGTTLYAKQKGKWAVLSPSEDSLGSAAADPTPALSDLAEKYLVSVRGSVQNIPADRRDQFINAMKALVQLGLASQAQGMNADQQAMQAATIKQAFDGLDKLSKELDSLVIGLGIDSTTKSFFMDIETRAVAGSDLAKSTASMKDLKTDFAGFVVPGAAMTMVAAGTTTDEEVAQLKQTLGTVKTAVFKALDDNEDLGDKKRNLAKELINDFIEVGQKTAETKKSDAAMAIVLGDTPAIIVGEAIAAGDKLDSALRKAFKELEAEQPEIAKLIKLDAEEYAGAKFHVATIPVPAEAGAKKPSPQEVFGETVQIVVGVSDSRLYIGAGKDSVAVLKKAIDASKENAGKSVSPVEMVISGEPIAKFIAKVAPDSNPSDAQAKKQAAKLASQFGKTSGKDRITLTVKPIENGASMRLSVDSGVSKALIQLINLASGAASADSSDEN